MGVLPFGLGTPFSLSRATPHGHSGITTQPYAMIRLQRSIRPRNGKNIEAVAWAKEVAEYLNTHYTVGQIEVYTERFGDLGAIHWVMDFRDLNALDSLSQQLRKDDAYNALIRRGDALTVDGSVRDIVLTLM